MAPSAPDKTIRDLLRGLASNDPREVRQAGDRLLDVGPQAVMPLIATLRAGEPSARRAAAFLLGRMETSTEAQAALVDALSDSDPKVRKNAVISLGKAQDDNALPPLVALLEAEEVSWVRPSVVLAVGQIGGSNAERALSNIEPRSETEAEAIRKALDRAVKRTDIASWRDLPTATEPIFVSTPPGVEDVATSEAEVSGFPKPSMREPGILEFPNGVHPRELHATLRCIHTPHFFIGRAPAPRKVDGSVEAPISKMLQGTTFLSHWRDWVDVGSAPLAYRFALTGVRTSKKAFLEVLAVVRAHLLRLGLEDRPSNYAIEIRLDVSRDTMTLWATPMFQADERFRYRVSDVGASINPVVAACLSRLVRQRRSSTAIDPTCGSGTLLIERALLDPHLRLVGFDISPTAVRAAKANVAAAGLQDRITIVQRDATDDAAWAPCDEAIMNLPFGIRSGRQDRDLPAVYAGILRGLSKNLNRGGQGLIYTANASLLTRMLRDFRNLKVVSRRNVTSGGLSVGIWLLQPLASRS